MQNNCLFDNKLFSLTDILHQVKALCLLYAAPKQKQKIRIIGPIPQLSYPCGFFDGAAADDHGGAGFVLHILVSHFLSFSLGCGKSTNTRAELLALWVVLAVSKLLGIPLHSTFGDSLVIINWANRRFSLDTPGLKH